MTFVSQAVFFNTEIWSDVTLYSCVT